VNLSVTDAEGNSNEQSFEITAGNAAPEVDLVITEGNQSFFFPGSPLAYNIKVKDNEDGTEISPGVIAVNFDYAPEGYDPIAIAQNHRASDEWTLYVQGKSLINDSDCLSCHRVDVSSIGPSYLQVAEKYPDSPENKALLAGRILSGSVGIWGEHAMSAHPDLPMSSARMMIDYILSLDNADVATEAIPLEGTYVPEVPAGENGKGGYLLRASYTDRGAGALPTLATEKIIALRNPMVNSEHFDVEQGTQLTTTPGRSFNVVEDGGYIGFEDLDLTGIGELLIHAEAPSRAAAAGGVIEVRLDTPDGTLVGSTEKVAPLDIDFWAELGKLRASWEAGGKKGPRPGRRELTALLMPGFAVPLGDIEGKHDVFFVVRNGDAKTGQILVQLNNIEFKEG
ncbi:MAG: carbohydrate-binding protein, partial [Lewinella sp.]